MTHDATAKQVHNIPLSPRALRYKPGRPVRVREVAPGHYFHYGLREAILD